MACCRLTPIRNVWRGAASNYSAQDIILGTPKTAKKCPWCNYFFGVNTSHPGAKFWYASNAALYKDFDVDLLKADCYYGTRDATPHDMELEMFANSIAESHNPVVISLSPGVNATTPEAADIHAKVNMYRISDDLHDCWNNDTKCDCGDHIAVSQQFGKAPWLVRVAE